MPKFSILPVTYTNIYILPCTFLRHSRSNSFPRCNFFSRRNTATPLSLRWSHDFFPLCICTATGWTTDSSFASKLAAPKWRVSNNRQVTLDRYNYIIVNDYCSSISFLYTNLKNIQHETLQGLDFFFLYYIQKILTLYIDKTI